MPNTKRILRALQAALKKSPDSYRTALRSALRDGASDGVFDQHDDFLFSLADSDPGAVALACGAILETLPEAGRFVAAGYAWHTLLKCQIRLGLGEQSLKTLRSGFDYVIKHHLPHVGRNLCQDAVHAGIRDVIRVDEVPRLFGEYARFHTAMGEHDRAVHALCAAASTYGDLGAFQSAYRALNDAQDIVHGHGLADEQIAILGTQGVVATQEGDNDCAEREFEKIRTLCEESGRPVPDLVWRNLAALMLRRGKYIQAKPILEAQLLEMTKSGRLADCALVQGTINLAVCCRETGEYARAIELAERAIEILAQMEEDELFRAGEAPIEARLVAASCRLRTNDTGVASQHLRAAIFLIDGLLDSASRLHYRRGIRARHVRRVRATLAELPPNGSVSDILHAIAFTRCNAMVDWFALLDWCENLFGNFSVPEDLRRRLENTLAEVIALGAPVLYGFREKYDDPLESRDGNEGLAPVDYARPWYQLNETVADIHRTMGGSWPMEQASCKRVAESIRGLLTTNRAGIFLFHVRDELQVVTLHSERYQRVSVALEPFFKLYLSLAAQSSGEGSRDATVAHMDQAVSALGPAVSAILDATQECQELVLFPDQLSHSVPFVAAVVGNPHFRERARAGLRLRSCRVLPASVREIAVAQGVACHPKWRMAHATKRQVRDPGGDGEGQARYRGMAVDAHEALSAA